MPRKYLSPIQIPQNAGLGKVLTSDATGISTWGNIDISDPTIPGGAKLQSMSRDVGIDNFANAASGTLQLTYIGVLLAGVTYSSVTFETGVTAGASLTHRWGCIVRLSDRVQTAVSADNVTTTVSANTAQTYTFGSAYTPTADEPSYIGVMIAGTTLPSWRGRTGGTTQLWGSITPRIAVTSNTGMTTPVATGTVMTAFTDITNRHWGYLS